MCPCVCVSRCLERLAGRIFLKFGMVMENRKIRRITEPDFRFWISILILRTLRVQNGRFSYFSAIISKTALRILLIFLYVVVLDVVYLLKKPHVPEKSGSGVMTSGKVENSLKNHTLFDAIFGGDALISTEVKII